MKHLRNVTTCALLLASPLLCTPGQAQTSQSHSGANMWGTVPGGVSVPGMLDSAIGHAQNGTVAGQVYSAKGGYLTSGGVTVQSIGSQSIIQNTIVGNNNSSTTTGTQTSTNSGSVSNTGVVK